MKVLVTGAGGQVGRALIASAPAGIEIKACTHADLDISDAAAVIAAVSAWRPALIINAAAYTAVDKAESEPEQARAINAAGPANLASAALNVAGCRLLQLSTDYVFDGRTSRPYRPADPTGPTSVYGSTKLAGEQIVREILGDRSVILRTAWVYAPEGRNFVLTMLRLMRERGAVRVVADQFGCPTSADSIARACWAIAARPAVHGILHWTDAGRASWCDFARAIAEEAQAIGLLPGPVSVTPISTAEYPTPARRPANSVLDTSEAVAQLGFAPRPWREELRATLARIQAAA